VPVSSAQRTSGFTGLGKARIVFLCTNEGLAVPMTFSVLMVKIAKRIFSIIDFLIEEVKIFYAFHTDTLTIIEPGEKPLEEAVKDTTDSSEPAPFKCEVDGTAYYEGQRFYPKNSPCLKCLCQKGYNGRFIGKSRQQRKMLSIRGSCCFLSLSLSPFHSITFF
jgi:hypothetical protein